LPGRLRTPCTAIACRGPKARKTLRDRDGSIGDPYLARYWLPDKAPVLVACASSRSGEGFCGDSPSAREAVQGVRRWRGEKRCQRRVFQGLRRSRDPASKSEQCRGDKGASPSETPEHRKTRTAHAPQDTGVDRRLMWF
jgi:hypothetical protein